MATNKKISEFPVTTSLAGNDAFLINHLGSTSTVSFSSLSAAVTNDSIKLPSTSTGGQVLTYNGSTSTWVASSANIPTKVYDSVPIGSVHFFATSTAPTGYLECDGGIVSKSTYSDLWTTIGDTFSAVALSANHFRLPDLRGEFIRGWDHGREVDTGRVLGSNQTYSTARPIGNNNSYIDSGGTIVTDTVTNRVLGFAGVSNVGENSTATATDNGGAGTQLHLGLAFIGDAETRPRNVALLPCIKALKQLINLQ